MKTITLTLILLCCTAAFAQKTFDIKDASKFFDIKVNVAKCDADTCAGKASFSFYKKGGTTPYQVINLPDTYIDLSSGGKPLVNVTMLYDEQSVVNVGDFNFDGMEDVALCDGGNGAYGMPSYQIYLSSRTAKKFVLDPAFTKLAHSLGMFTVDAKAKTLETYNKDGCCWHVTDRYDVVGGRPRKIFEEIEDATIPDEKKVKVTTKRLVGGRWKTSVKYIKREE